jgi:putative hydrolase of the HAD superfamily
MDRRANLLVKAVGFDLGDTLVYYEGTPLNWKSLYPDALRHMAAGFRLEPSAHQIAAAEAILERYNTRIHPRTVEVSCDEIIAQILEAWSLPIGSLLDTATGHFFQFFQRDLAVYEDTEKVLRWLKESHVPVGILTDVPYGMRREYVDKDLNASIDIRPFVDVLMTSVEVGCRKPAPKGYLELASELGVLPQELVYVGNEQKDIQGAVAAGVPAVLISRDGTISDWGQFATVSTLAALCDLAVLKELAGPKRNDNQGAID